MRQIKFRAWDKNKRIFLPDDTFAILTNQEQLFVMIKDFENYKEGEYGYVDSFEVIQFTGLHDKNGKEIYEGNIVKYMYLNTMPTEKRIATVKLMPIGDVNRNITAYYPFCYSISGSYKEEKREVAECYLTPSDAFEIIGNIYQNPELLP